MASLNIRKLPEEVHQQLRLRAARAGRSMEAEARDILAAACLGQEASLPYARLQQLVEELYHRGKPRSATDDLIAERRREVQRG